MYLKCFSNVFFIVTHVGSVNMCREHLRYIDDAVFWFQDLLGYDGAGRGCISQLPVQKYI